MNLASLKRALIVTGVLVCDANAANFVDGLGREWRQLTDTVGYSWTQINTGGVDGCNASTGFCSGRLGGSGTHLEGWTWASAIEVNQLFHDLGINDGAGTGFGSPAAGDPVPSSPISYAKVDSAWAPAILFNGPFTPTSVAPGNTIADGLTFVSGYSRSLQYPEGGSTNFSMNPHISDWGSGKDDQAATAHLLWTGFLGTQTDGVWMYRVSAVPEPDIYHLAAVGLVMVGFVAHRRRTAHALLRRRDL